MDESKDKPNLGLPWTIEESHPWRIMCETNIPGVKNVVATVAYRPMAELIVNAANAHEALVEALKVVEAAFFAHAEPASENIGRGHVRKLDNEQHPWIPGAEAWPVVDQVRAALALAKGKES